MESKRVVSSQGSVVSALPRGMRLVPGLRSLAIAAAVALATGGAWAKTYTKVFEQTFDDAETYTQNFYEGSVASDIFGTSDSASLSSTLLGTIEQRQRYGATEGQKFAYFSRSGKAQLNRAVYKFPEEVTDENLTDYKLQFDYYLSPLVNASYHSGMLIKGETGIIATFDKQTTGGNNKTSNDGMLIYGSGNSHTNLFTTGQRGADPSNTTWAPYWLHVTIEGNEANGLYLSVVQDNGSIVLPPTRVSSFQHIECLFFNVDYKSNSNNAKVFSLDNVICQKGVTADYSWTGAEENDSNWTTPGNWTVDGVPQTSDYPGLGDNVTISLKNQTIYVDANSVLPSINADETTILSVNTPTKISSDPQIHDPKSMLRCVSATGLTSNSIIISGRGSSEYVTEYKSENGGFEVVFWPKSRLYWTGDGETTLWTNESNWIYGNGEIPTTGPTGGLVLFPSTISSVVNVTMESILKYDVKLIVDCDVKISSTKKGSGNNDYNLLIYSVTGKGTLTLQNMHIRGWQSEESSCNVPMIISGDVSFRIRGNGGNFQFSKSITGDGNLILESDGSNSNESHNFSGSFSGFTGVLTLATTSTRVAYNFQGDASTIDFSLAKVNIASDAVMTIGSSNTGGALKICALTGSGTIKNGKTTEMTLEIGRDSTEGSPMPNLSGTGAWTVKKYGASNILTIGSTTSIPSGTTVSVLEGAMVSEATSFDGVNFSFANGTKTKVTLTDTEATDDVELFRTTGIITLNGSQSVDVTNAGYENNTGKWTLKTSYIDTDDDDIEDTYVLYATFVNTAVASVGGKDYYVFSEAVEAAGATGTITVKANVDEAIVLGGQTLIINEGFTVTKITAGDEYEEYTTPITGAAGGTSVVLVETLTKSAANYIWNGSSNDEWGTLGNWSYEASDGRIIAATRAPGSLSSDVATINGDNVELSEDVSIGSLVNRNAVTIGKVEGISGTPNLSLGSALNLGTAGYNADLTVTNIEVTVAKDLLLGIDATDGTAEKPGDWGKLTIAKEAKVTVTTGETLIGRRNYSSGAVVVDGGELLVGASNDSVVGLGIANASNGTGTLEVKNGGSATFNNRTLYIGGKEGKPNARGVLEIDNGTVKANSGFAMAGGSGDYGYLSIDNGGKLEVTGNISLGGTGEAVIDLKNGTLSTTGYLESGNNAASKVRINVSGGTLSTTGNMYLSKFSSGGSGKDTILDVTGGRVAVGDSAWIGHSQSYAEIHVSGTGEIDITNSLEMPYGGACTALVEVATGGTLKAKTIKFGHGWTNSNGLLELVGGTVETEGFAYGDKDGDVDTIFLNGGTIKAKKSSTSFLSANSHVTTTLGASGVTIDTSTYNITIGAELTDGASGTSAGITKTGTGTLTLSAPFNGIKITVLEEGGSVVIPSDVNFVLGENTIVSGATAAGVTLSYGTATGAIVEVDNGESGATSYNVATLAGAIEASGAFGGVAKLNAATETTGTLVVGNVAGTTQQLDIDSYNLTLDSTATPALSIGAYAGATGVVYQTALALANSSETAAKVYVGNAANSVGEYIIDGVNGAIAPEFYVAPTDNSYGHLVITNSTVKFDQKLYIACVSNGGGSKANARIDVLDGASVTLLNDLKWGHGVASYSVLNIDGGVVTNNANGSNFAWGGATTARVDIAHGKLKITGNLQLGNSYGDQNVEINLNEDGELELNELRLGAGKDGGVNTYALNFNGGKMKVNWDFSTPANGTYSTIAYNLGSGGLTVDSNGKTVNFTEQLVDTSGDDDPGCITKMGSGVLTISAPFEGMKIMVLKDGGSAKVPTSSSYMPVAGINTKVTESDGYNVYEYQAPWQADSQLFDTLQAAYDHVNGLPESDWTNSGKTCIRLLVAGTNSDPVTTDKAPLWLLAAESGRNHNGTITLNGVELTIDINTKGSFNGPLVVAENTENTIKNNSQNNIFYQPSGLTGAGTVTIYQQGGKKAVRLSSNRLDEFTGTLKFITSGAPDGANGILFDSAQSIGNANLAVEVSTTDAVTSPVNALYTEFGAGATLTLKSLKVLDANSSVNYKRNLNINITDDSELRGAFVNSTANLAINKTGSGKLTLGSGFSASTSGTKTLNVTAGAIEANGAMDLSDWTVSLASSVTVTVADSTSTLTLASGEYSYTCGANTKVDTTTDPEKVVFSWLASPEPGQTDGNVYDSAEAAQAVAAKYVDISIPSAVASSLDDEQKTAYKALFSAQAVESTTTPGKYVVVVDFAPAKKTELEASLTQEFADVDLSSIGSSGGIVTVESPIAGLYYGVLKGTEPTGLSLSGSRVLSDGTALDLTLPSGEGTVYFYKLQVSTTAD